MCFHQLVGKPPWHNQSPSSRHHNPACQDPTRVLWPSTSVTSTSAKGAFSLPFVFLGLPGCTVFFSNLKDLKSLLHWEVCGMNSWLSFQCNSAFCSGSETREVCACWQQQGSSCWPGRAAPLPPATCTSSNAFLSGEGPDCAALTLVGLLK